MRGWHALVLALCQHLYWREGIGGLSYLGEFLTISYDIMLDSNLKHSHFNVLKRREDHMPLFSHSVNIFTSGEVPERVVFCG